MDDAVLSDGQEPREIDLDDLFGGSLDSEDELDPVGAENRDINLPVPAIVSQPAKAKLLWVSAGVYEGPSCTADAEASLKAHAQEPWFESKARKSRDNKREGIPLTQTPRTLIDGTVISEFRCPFSQVLSLRPGPVIANGDIPHLYLPHLRYATLSPNTESLRFRCSRRRAMAVRSV